MKKNNNIYMRCVYCGNDIFEPITIDKTHGENGCSDLKAYACETCGHIEYFALKYAKKSCDDLVDEVIRVEKDWEKDLENGEDPGVLGKETLNLYEKLSKLF